MKDFKKKGIDKKKVYRTDIKGNAIPAELTENEFLILKSDTAINKTLLGQYFMQEALIAGR